MGFRGIEMKTNNLKFNTCGLADTMISYYDTMKENGMPEDELEIVMDSYMKIVELNQKYVKLSEDHIKNSHFRKEESE